MARVRITHSFDVGAVQVMMRSPVDGVGRDMYRRGQNVRTRALRLAAADTGRLRASIHVELTEHGGVAVARLGSNVAYAAFHHEGHGPCGRSAPRSWSSRPGRYVARRPRVRPRGTRTSVADPNQPTC
jgi:hypothetical protein